MFDASLTLTSVCLVCAHAQVEQVQAFADQADKLGTAEQFFLQLSAVPSYETRVECMLLQCELREKFTTLLPDIEAIVASGRAVDESQALALFFRYSLHTGNFINAVGASVTWWAHACSALS